MTIITNLQGCQVGYCQIFAMQQRPLLAQLSQSTINCWPVIFRPLWCHHMLYDVIKWSMTSQYVKMSLWQESHSWLHKCCTEMTTVDSIIITEQKFWYVLVGNIVGHLLNISEWKSETNSSSYAPKHKVVIVFLVFLASKLYRKSFSDIDSPID